jgi:hypothetical protein
LASSMANFTPPPPRRGARFWIGLAGIVGGSLCLCLVLIIGFSYLTKNSLPTPSTSIVSAGASPTSPSKPATTSSATGTAAPARATPQPAAPSATPTNLPPASLTPTQPSATDLPSVVAPPPANSATEFHDDFSNPNSGWAMTITDGYSLDYNQDLSYTITLNQPNQLLYSPAPVPFTKPVKNILVSVRGRLSTPGSGLFGVMCNLQDNQNYDFIAISGNRFAIGKMVNGTRTELTSPYWQPILSAKADADGYLTLQVSCFDHFIVLSVNDFGQAHVVDEDLSSGDVALFGASTDQKDADGNYVIASFKDFSAVLQ